MIVVSPILKRVVYPALANTGYLRRRARRGDLSILTYHGIAPKDYKPFDAALDGGLVTAETFRAHIRLLREVYNVIAPEEVREWVREQKELPPRAVLITCDDGLQSGLTEMAPILVQEGVSCLFFVPGASALGDSKILWHEELFLLLMGAPAGCFEFDLLAVDFRQQRIQAWRKLVQELSGQGPAQRRRFIEDFASRYGSSRKIPSELWTGESFRQRFGLLRPDELRQLSEMGMSIGSHTLSHPVLAEQPSEMAWQEISESRRTLEETIGKPVWALAYPFGDPASVTGREMQMAEQAGYECAFMNVGGGFGASLPRFALPRVHVSASMSLAEFEAHLSGFHRDIRSRWIEDL